MSVTVATQNPQTNANTRDIRNTSAVNNVFQTNNRIIKTSYVLENRKNALSVGPITINTGANVTIPAGSRWLIL